MSHPIVERILSGDAPFNLKQAAARGAMPIPREDLIELWVLLRADPDDEVRMACKENIAGVDEAEWIEILPTHPFDPRVLDFAVRILGRTPTLLQAALQNRGVTTDTLEWLAQHASGAPLDSLLDNQVRLIQSPSVVVAMLANNGLNPTQVRRIFDLSEQFFRDHPEIPSLLELRFGLKLGLAGGAFAPDLREEVLPEQELPSEILTLASIDEATLAAAEAEIPVALLIEEPIPPEEFKSLYQQILNMSIPAKVALALKGNKEARMLLIRDSNKVVQQAVIGSPKLTDSEVESIAKMRSIPDELVRQIARNKEWMKKYPILKALTINPKTPPGVAINLIMNLLDFDLKMLLKDKNVSEVVRREARRIWEVRNTRKVVPFKKH
ncbi:MAG: hypothetical protein B7X11_01430 [Acidobacteria bacterium 37-65-4]|nr:MAG: hypothetical protein B7X11_01430 [Acidobacteria bacterium 37-65-4]